MLRTGAPWRDLPCKFGPWQRTYKRFSRWTNVGLWAKLYRAMRGSEQKIGHFASLDSTSVRVHQHGAPTRTERDVQAVGISRGGKTKKIHLLAYQRRDGTLLAARGVLSPGQLSGICTAQAVLLRRPPSLRVLATDRAYDARWWRDWLRVRNVRLVIPYRRNHRGPGRLSQRFYAKHN